MITDWSLKKWDGDSDFFDAKKSTVKSVDFLIISWLGVSLTDGTPWLQILS